MYLYSIKDVKAGTYDVPFSAVNNAVAIRYVSNTLSEKNMLSLNPADFELYRVAEYDQVTGLVNGNLEHVINIVDLVQHDVVN